MRNLWHRTGVSILLVALALGILGGTAYVRSATEEPRRATLLCPGEPGFDDALDSYFPGIRDVPGFETIQPILAILKNDPSHHVLAYVVQWNLMGADGTTSKIYLPLMSEPGAQWDIIQQKAILSGQRIVLRSNETELVSPFFHISAFRFPGLRSTRAVATIVSVSLQRYFQLEPVVPQAVRASLDGVIYEDGAFVGADESRLYERYTAEQLIQRDEGKAILNLIRTGASDDDITGRLNQDILKGSELTAADNISLYDSACARVARRLLAEFQTGRGRTGLHAVAARLARARIISLRRAMTP